MLGSVLLALPRLPVALGQGGGHRGSCAAVDGLCEVLSAVHGTHLAESGSTRGLCFVHGGSEVETCLAGCSLAPGVMVV